jgi:hypothetical protein
MFIRLTGYKRETFGESSKLLLLEIVIHNILWGILGKVLGTFLLNSPLSSLLLFPLKYTVSNEKRPTLVKLRPGELSLK